MELTQLKYFQALAHSENLTQAAKNIALSQSALSRSLAKLEQEIGAPLIERHGKESHLTPSGERFLFHVERVLRELELAQQEINIENGKGGLLRLSFLHSIGDTYLPLILSEFHKQYPSIAIHLNQENSNVLAQQIEQGETDVGLCSLVSQENIAWMYLWSEELFLVVPKNHKLAGRQSVNLSEIDGEPFITLKSCYSLRQQINQFLDIAESHPTIIFEGDEVHNIISLVAAQLGVTLISRVPCTEELGVSYIPVTFPVCKRAIGIAWNSMRPLSSAAVCFQQFTINYFRNLNIS